MKRSRSSTGGGTVRTAAARPSTEGLRPALKRFGQHFLEPAWVEKLVRAIAPRPDDVFLEIGPGRGALTLPLLSAAGAVVAFEIDRVLASALRDSARDHLKVVEGDFLRCSQEDISAALPPEVRTIGTAARLRVAGNLPYNVASPILFRLVDLYAGGLPILDATVMLQREVADRLLASPCSKEYGTLTVLIGHHASVERLLSLPPGAFRPAPRVHSSVVRLRFHPPQPVAANIDVFRAVVQATFTRRRKTLANALLAYPGSGRLAPVEALRRAGLDGSRRPETLSIAEFVRLSDIYAEAASN